MSKQNEISWVFFCTFFVYKVLLNRFERVRQLSHTHTLCLLPKRNMKQMFGRCCLVSGESILMRNGVTTTVSFFSRFLFWWVDFLQNSWIVWLGRKGEVFWICVDCVFFLSQKRSTCVFSRKVLWGQFCVKTKAIFFHPITSALFSFFFDKGVGLQKNKKINLVSARNFTKCVTTSFLILFNLDWASWKMPSLGQVREPSFALFPHDFSLFVLSAHATVCVQPSPQCCNCRSSIKPKRKINCLLLYNRFWFSQEQSEFCISSFCKTDLVSFIQFQVWMRFFVFFFLLLFHFPIIFAKFDLLWHDRKTWMLQEGLAVGCVFPMTVFFHSCWFDFSGLVTLWAADFPRRSAISLFLSPEWAETIKNQLNIQVKWAFWFWFLLQRRFPIHHLGHNLNLLMEFDSAHLIHQTRLHCLAVFGHRSVAPDRVSQCYHKQISLNVNFQWVLLVDGQQWWPLVSDCSFCFLKFVLIVWRRAAVSGVKFVVIFCFNAHCLDNFLFFWIFNDNTSPWTTIW